MGQGADKDSEEYFELWRSAWAELRKQLKKLFPFDTRSKVWKKETATVTTLWTEIGNPAEGIQLIAFALNLGIEPVSFEIRV